MIEHLENRRLLSASVANGVLTVTGTDNADRINVVQRGAAVIVHQGSSISRFGKQGHVSSIVINALGGNDRIKVTSKLAATIDGGDGKDLIIGGSGDDVLMGGNGNDRILGQAGNDSISGGVGKDALFGGAGDDMIDAFDSELDQLSGGAGKDSARVDSQTDKAWNIEDYLSITTNSLGAVTDVSGGAAEIHVNAGKLITDPATNAGSGALVLSGGMSLGGSGSITGNVQISGSNDLTLSKSGSGTLRVSNISLSGSTFDLEGNASGIDRILITSDGAADRFTLGGGNTINLTNIGGTISGDYVIIDYNNGAPYLDALAHLTLSNNIILQVSGSADPTTSETAGSETPDMTA
jgi:Ca2+-binding RTX toxin-like protein